MASVSPLASGPVRIVLVDDHEMVIEGLKAMLAAFSDRVEVVGQAVGAERALSVVDELDPDIVLSDVRMQGSSGLDLCQTLRERQPGPQGRHAVGLRRRAVPLSGAAGRRVGISAEEHRQRRAGAPAGVRAQRRDRHRSRHGGQGGRHRRHGCSATSSGPARARASRSGRARSSRYVVNGLSNRGIASKLVIGDETVKTHLRSIYRKLGVSDRTGAVATALREGIYQ